MTSLRGDPKFTIWDFLALQPRIPTADGALEYLSKLVEDGSYSYSFFSSAMAESEALSAIDHDVVKLTFHEGFELFAKREELSVEGYRVPVAPFVIAKAEKSVEEIPSNLGREAVLPALIARIGEIGVGEELEKIIGNRLSYKGRFMLSVWINDESLIMEHGGVKLPGDNANFFGRDNLLEALEIAWLNKTERAARAILELLRLNVRRGNPFLDVAHTPKFGEKYSDQYLVGWSPSDDKVALVGINGGLWYCSLKTALDLKLVRVKDVGASILGNRLVTVGARTSIKELFSHA
jgi:hypothetical protein